MHFRTEGIIILFGGIRLMLDNGTTGLREIDGIVCRKRARGTPLGRSGQTAVMPSGDVAPMGAVRRVQEGNGWFADLAEVDLNLGAGIDGLLGFRGIARWEFMHGLQIHHQLGCITLRSPRREIPSLPITASKTTVRRMTAQLRNITKCEARWGPALRSTLQGCTSDMMERISKDTWVSVRQFFVGSPDDTSQDTGEDEALCKELEEKLREEFSDVLRDELSGPPRAELQRDIQVRLPEWDRRIPHPPRPYQIPQSDEQKQFIAAEFDKLKALGILEERKSSFEATCFCVDKDLSSERLDKKYRMVMNFRPINKGFPKATTNFPKIPDILGKICRHNWLAAADITSAFYQIAVHQDDRHYLGVRHPLSAEPLQFTAWPFGFSWSPTAMQRYAEPLVAGEEAEVYMDDLTWGGDHPRELYEKTRRLLLTARERGTIISKSKLQLFRKEMDVLGHRVVAGRGYTVLASRAQEIVTMQPPKNVDELERAIGIFTYIASAVPDFSRTIAPLRALLTDALKEDRVRRGKRKGGPRPSLAFFPLDGLELRAFQSLQDAMLNPAFILPFEIGKRVTLVADASQVAVGAALFQLDQEGKPRLRGYFSKALSDAQTRWKVFDLEAYAVVSALERWETNLKGSPVTIVSDHKGLSALFKEAPRLTGRSARWVASLLDFDLTLRHATGESFEMAFADYLSRNPTDIKAALAAASDAGEEIELLRPSPCAVRALNIQRGIGKWTSDKQKRRLRAAVAGTLEERMKMTMRAFGEGWIPQTRRRWLELGEEEERRSLEAVQVRRIAAPSDISFNADSQLINQIREAQVGYDEWQVVGQQGGTEEREGILFKHGQPILREGPLFNALFLAAHDSPMAGHRGVQATMARIQENFFIPKLRELVTSRIASCVACRQSKVDTRRRTNMQAVETHMEPFRTIHVDAMTGLPRGSGYDKLWLIVDRCTHFVTLIPAQKTDDAARTAERICSGHYCWFGLPDDIISDQDVLFTAEFTRALNRVMGVHQSFSTARRKEGNGMAERQMRTIREFMRAYAAEMMERWVHLLPSAQFALNTSINAATGIAPLHIVLGRAPSGPWTSDIIRQDIKDFLVERAKLREDAFDHIHGKQVDMLLKSNLTRVKKNAVCPGNYVFVSGTVLPHPRQTHLPTKLRNAFNGPFKVVEEEDERGNIRIQLSYPFRKESFMVHVDEVRVWQPFETSASPAVQGSSTATRTRGESLSDPTEHFLQRREQQTGSRSATLLEDEYIVENLLDVRGEENAREFLVQWEGYDDPTWEPESNILSETMVQEFLNKD